MENTHKPVNPPEESKEFSTFDLSPRLQKALAEAGFLKATYIQQVAIPIGLSGQDIIGCAQTGTGKTAAFLLPIITHLENNPQETALITAPTREIVHQIADMARVFLKHHTDIRTCAIIGGARESSQLANLARKPRLIVGTPGRLNDFLKRRKVDLRNCRTLVFDEADRMLDMGFAPQIDEIVKYVPTERQTMMFSATMAAPVEKLARTYLKDPKFVSVGKQETAPELLRQKVIVTTLEKKESALTDELATRKGSILIFAQTQRKVEKLSYKLNDYGFTAEAIHGGRTQGQRFRALKSFKEGSVNILVATDVASRGLDIGNISHVINFDLPTNPEDFLHRIGRTARNGKDGEALSLILDSDFGEYNRIKKYLINCETVGEFSRNQSSSNSGGSQRRRGGGGGGGGNRRRSGAASGGGGGRGGNFKFANRNKRRDGGGGSSGNRSPQPKAARY